MKIFENETKRINKIKETINNPDVKVVSFDIFDTLLVRPVIEPSDIIFLLSKKYAEYKDLFLKYRNNAEKEIKKENITIYDIWNHIAKKRNISDAKKNFFIKEELNLEYNFLYSRKLGHELFDYAIKLNKRIILTSDMYLPSEFLNKVLHKNGYNGYKKIYISCECNFRKDSGKLYSYILKKEKIKSNQIVHIGDNRYSDYKMAKKQGLNVCWLPSNLTLFLKNDAFGNYISLKELVNLDYEDRILFGFIINTIYDQVDSKNFSSNLTLENFSKLIILPILLNILIITNKKKFQDEYGKLFFAARDGYLPSQAFKICNYYHKVLPYKYFMASRQAYSCIIYPTPYSKLNYDKFDQDYTLSKYLDLIIIDNHLLNFIKQKMSKDELNLKVNDNKNLCKKILKKFDDQINASYKERQKATQEYYTDIINSNKKRVAVFDCGYSGSISIALSKVLHNKFKVDKVYLYQYEKNIERDKKNKTITYTVLKYENKAPWFDVLLETMFSPLVGSCKGFIQKGNKIIPILEKDDIDSNMERDITLVQKMALLKVADFAKIFDNYWDCLDKFNLSIYSNLLLRLFNKHKKNAKIFQNIVFKDTYCTDNTITLEEIIRGENRIKRLISKLRNVL